MLVISNLLFLKQIEKAPELTGAFLILEVQGSATHLFGRI